MFKKLISNLAFSPALVGQLGFYAKRLKKEEATRRIGLIFTALALIVQSFAVFSPPESANASSPNDFVQGGVSSVTEFLAHYDTNRNNLKDLFTVLGITRANIANTHKQVINTQNVYSWGQLPQFSAAQGERSFTIRTSSGGQKTFYYRPLDNWTNGKSRNLTMLVGTTSTGKWFAIMLECGNLILKEVPPQPQCPTGQTGTYPNCTTPPKMCTVPGKEKLPANSPDCKPNPVAACQSLSISTLTNNRYQLQGTASTQYGATVSQYIYQIYRDGKLIDTKTVSSTASTNSYVYSQSTKGTYTVKLTVKTSLGDKTSASCAKNFSIVPPAVCAVNPRLPKSSPECQPCPGDESIWIKDEKCKASLIETKTAINTTQNGNASEVIAHSSDQITYTINVENKGLAPTSVVIKENLADVLQYATVTNNGSGNLNENTLTWPAITLKPGEKQTRMFTVKVLETIPAMPKGASDGTSYDCKMTNTFGNTVDVNVNCPVEKEVVEQTVAELPHTGPTENMIFAGVVLAVVAYFYARARQVKKEVRLIRRDFNAGTI